MKTKLATLSATLGVLTVSGLSQTYYTVDVTNDALYTINPTTGVAAFQGYLGTDVDGVDMAWHKGALYAKSFNTSAGTRVFQIVTTGMYSGFALPGALVNGGGYQGAEMAGLASNGTDIYVTYSNQLPVNFYSLSFGKINPWTGTITYMNNVTADADAMGYAGGKFWSVDVVAPGSGYQIYSGTFTPVTYVGGDTYDNSLATNPVDIENYSATQLVMMGQTGKNLVRIWKANGTRVVSTPITGAPSNAVFKGIAQAPGCPSWWYVNPN